MVKTMEEQNMALMRRWFSEVWNNAREEAIDEMYAEDGIAHGLGQEHSRGTAQFKQLHRAFQEIFTDIRFEVDDIMASGDRVALRCSGTMKHIATGKTVRLDGSGFNRIEDGKRVEAWNAWDFIGCFSGMEVVPENMMELCLSGQKLAPL